MYKMIKVEIITISPEEAKEYLKFNVFESQRNKNESWVKILVEKMMAGHFRTGEISIAILPDGTTLLMNGQHQLQAIIISGKTITSKLETYTCQDAIDLSLLFRQFDTDVNNRTLRDAIKVEHNALGLKGSHTISHMLIISHYLWKGKYGKNKMSKDRRISKLSQLSDKNCFLNIIFGKSRPGFMFKQAVVSAMLNTFERSRDDALLFWEGVLTGEMLKATDPSFRLREYLISVNQERVARRVNLPREIHSKCITAWNAYRLGKTTRLNYFPNKPRPTAI